ncbi:MAG: 50S ribosomal protein L17 [Bacteroidetes bacterium]|nr:50S ribosomal protein L17 [Bacteroidota bacterium]
MRHAKVGRRLSRTASHRKALLSALSIALIKHKRIRTTTAKAKETRRVIEPIITRARDAYLREKSGEPVDVHARREIARFIRDKDALQMLFSDVAEKVGKRPGGYTRVLKLGHRLGDGAEMAVIELVDYNEAQDSKQRKERAARSKAAAQRRKAAEERKGKAEKGGTTSTEKAAKAAGSAAAAMETVADQTAKAIDETAGAVEEVIDSAVETAAETAEEVKDAATEVIDRAADKAENVAEDVVDAVDDAVDAVKEKAEDILPDSDSPTDADSSSDDADAKKES